MDEFKDILIDGVIEVDNEGVISKLQELPCFEQCRLDYYNDINCDKKDLKSFVLTEGMSFIGKGHIKSIEKSLVMDEKTKDLSSKLYVYVIITGIFDAIQTNGVKRKFYL